MNILKIFSKINPSIKVKLNIGFGAIIVLLLFIGLYNIYTSYQNLKSAKRIVQIYNPSSMLMTEYLTLMTESNNLIHNWVYVEKISNTPNKQRLKSLIDSNYVHLSSNIEKISKKWDKNNQDLFLKTHVNITDTLFEKYKMIMTNLNSLEAYDDPMVVFEIFPMLEKDGEVSVLTDSILLNIEHLQESINMKSTNGGKSLIKRFTSEITFSAVIFFMILLIVVFIIFTITKSVKGLLSKINFYLNRIKKGDLSKISLSGQKDESYYMLEGMNNVMSKFRLVLSEIYKSGKILMELSKKLDTGANEISELTFSQAKRVEEVVKSVSEMKNNIAQNSINSKTTQEIVSDAVDKISENNDNVRRTVVSLQEIIDNINFIGDIAFQIDILSLNAAIEAARAGKYGKGFRVVAAEVGALADKSKKASNYIEELSEGAIHISKETESKSLALIPEIQKTEDLIKGVASANDDLTKGVDSINTAIKKLNNISNNNNLFAKEMAENASHLSKQARKLFQAVKFFKTQ